MIESETIVLIYSNVVQRLIYSEDEPDYRILEGELRLLEDEGARNLEDENKRLLE